MSVSRAPKRTTSPDSVAFAGSVAGDPLNRTRGLRQLLGSAPLAVPWRFPVAVKSQIVVRGTPVVLNRSTQQSGKTPQMVSSNSKSVEGGC